MMERAYKKRDDAGYEALARAVVIQAVQDWRRAMKKLSRNPNNISAKKDAAECERFFRSQWFFELSGLNGDMVLRKLKEEI